MAGVTSFIRFRKISCPSLSFLLLCTLLSDVPPTTLGQFLPFSNPAGNSVPGLFPVLNSGDNKNNGGIGNGWPFFGGFYPQQQQQSASPMRQGQDQQQQQGMNPFGNFFGGYPGFYNPWFGNQQQQQQQQPQKPVQQQPYQPYVSPYGQQPQQQQQQAPAQQYEYQNPQNQNIQNPNYQQPAATPTQQQPVVGPSTYPQQQQPVNPQGYPTASQQQQPPANVPNNYQVAPVQPSQQQQPVNTQPSPSSFPANSQWNPNPNQQSAGGNNIAPPPKYEDGSYRPNSYQATPSNSGYDQQNQPSTLNVNGEPYNYSQQQQQQPANNNNELVGDVRNNSPKEVGQSQEQLLPVPGNAPGQGWVYPDDA